MMDDEYENSEAMPEDRGVSLEELKTILDQELSKNLSYLSSQLSIDREKALDYYYGRKKGAFTAQEGRSSVVTRDVQETIEWATAQIIRMFTGEDYVVFDPQNPDDVEQARQETEYVNYVVQRENEGFKIIHDWVKDGLLSRVGVIHVGWDDTPKFQLEMYEGLTEGELEMLLAEEGTELVELTQGEVQIPVQQQDPQTGEVMEVMQPLPVFDVRVRHERPTGKCVITNIAPEDFIIERGARCIEDADFAAHRYRVSRSELRLMGVDEETIERITGQGENVIEDAEQDARDVTDDFTIFEELDGISNETRKTWAYDCYLKIDWDGDGYCELRRVTYIGKEIIANDPVEEIPYAVFCPVPMPHTFYGQSYADLVMDLQEIRTALMRGALDNLYLSNMPMKEVVEGQVNLEDILSPRAGGIVRVKQPGMVTPQVTPNMLAPTLQAIEQVDSMRESRTGLTRYNQGLDAESLNKTAAGMNMILNQSQLRIELVTRIFAESGLKRGYKLVHGVLRRHQDKPRMVKLTGGFVEVSPQEWRERTEMSVTVGLGNGTRDQQLGGIQQLIQQQSMDVQMGLQTASPQNMYNARTKMASLLGYKDSINYFTPPPSPEEQQQMAQQQAQAQQQAMEQQMQMQAQLQAQLEQAKAQARMAEAQMKYQHEAQKAQAEHQMKLAEIAAQEQQDGRKLDLDRAKAERDYEIKIAELQQEHAHFVAEQNQERELTEKKLTVDGMKYTRESDIERQLMQELQEDEQAD